jgi:hypothetical protein
MSYGGFKNQLQHWDSSGNCTLERPAVRARGTAKAFANGAHAAVVVTHQYEDCTVFGYQMNVIARQWRHLAAI